MINVNFNLASLCGIIYLLWGIVYIILVLTLIFRRTTNINDSSRLIYVIQAIVFPFFFLIISPILIVYGWRFDPIMQFGQFFQTVLVIYISIKELLMTFSRNR
ncbi:Ycf66 family protein [Argonema antarcticum]|uniref:Ycf66 family protein n=1 Tax=Argonema antarcticum TaxID=2942763 RepID=UPI003B845D84|nr:Ycf66 family protein [Argonema antarcticum A004/B2]